MKQLELWKLSLMNIMLAPVRSVLTVLGFAIGVAAILAVLTLGEAGKVQVESEMERLGIDQVWITPVQGEYIQKGTADWLEENTGIEASELIYFSSVVEEIQEKVTVIGCDNEYLSAMGIRLKQGRMLRQMEWNEKSPNVMIGAKFAERTGIKAGEWMTVHSRCFYVCGVLEAVQGVSSVSIDESVVIPIETACQLSSGMVQEIQLSVPDKENMERMQSLAVKLLEQQGIQSNALNMKIQMDAASNVIWTFVNVLKWVALVCILVGGIGVMNIMLVNVRERKREIGVMKSMGATSLMICSMFLIEALAYAAAGGFAGIIAGFGLIALAGKSIDLAARASVGDCLTVLSCALGTGLFFGVAPALRACKLSCVDALRQE